MCLREREALTYPDNVVIKEMKMNVKDKRQRVGKTSQNVQRFVAGQKGFALM